MTDDFFLLKVIIRSCQRREMKLSDLLFKPDDHYTAREAAEKLRLEYHTFMARARVGKYNPIKIGSSVFFNKKEINQHANN